MSQNDKRILDRFDYLKRCRWPKSIRMHESSTDLTGTRIDEREVQTIDDFEQCWREMYYTASDYDFLNHLLSGAVVSEIKRLARRDTFSAIDLEKIDSEIILQQMHRSIDHAIREGDIQCFDDLFPDRTGETYGR